MHSGTHTIITRIWCSTAQEQLHCCTYCLDASFEISGEVGLGIIWNAPELPWKSGSVVSERWSGEKSLVVVPVSDDVDGTGENNHPGYGLVEGEVFVQKTFDGARGALDMMVEGRRGE